MLFEWRWMLFENILLIPMLHCNPAAFQYLSRYWMMVSCSKFGFGGRGRGGVFRCDRGWVRHRKRDIPATPACFQAGLSSCGQSYVVEQIIMEPIEGEGGKRLAKIFVYTYLPLLRAQPSEASQSPNPHRSCGPT